MKENECRETLIKISAQVFVEVNEFALKTLQTRGGRIGSGMGLLLEALWGYHLNVQLLDYPFELA